MEIARAKEIAFQKSQSTISFIRMIAESGKICGFASPEAQLKCILDKIKLHQKELDKLFDSVPE